MLTNVSDDAKLLDDEIFGPVAAIQTFKTEDEVIRRANDTEYGLVAYVYTGISAAACACRRSSTSAWSASTAALVSDPAAAFGGTKQSGLGREGAHVGLMEFLETQYVSVTW